MAKSNHDRTYFGRRAGGDRGPSRRHAEQFFPESERTGPPVGGLPLSTARELPGGRARRTRAGRGDMNRDRCRRKRCASGQNAVFRRIRQSTRCQQKEQLMLWLLSAVNRELDQAASQHIADARVKVTVPEHACGSNTVTPLGGEGR
jgi:hypothetical protein